MKPTAYQFYFWQLPDYQVTSDRQFATPPNGDNVQKMILKFGKKNFDDDWIGNSTTPPIKVGEDEGRGGEEGVKRSGVNITTRLTSAGMTRAADVLLIRYT